MDLGKVSIIIPVYNSAGLLERCIESVLAQSYKNFELFLVDDNSTDSSGKICDEYAKKDNRIKVIHHTKNRGLSVSREDGFIASNSEWVSFIDNDDIISPDMYETMLKLSNENKAELVCIRGEDKTEENLQNPKWDTTAHEPFVLLGKDACNKLYSNKLGFPLAQPIWGKLIKRSLIERALVEVKPYKEKLFWVYFEDVLFTPMVYYYADKVVFYNKLMYMHRRVKTNLSSSLQPKEFHYQSVDAGFEVLNFFERKNLRQAFDTHIIGCFLNTQSIWFKVWKNEKDILKAKKFYKSIDTAFDKYGKKLKCVKCHDFGTLIKKWNISFFKLNRTLWGLTAGNLYFNILNRKTYG